MTDSLAEELATAEDSDTYLAIESRSAGAGRFGRLEDAAAAVLRCAFGGRTPVYARARNAPVFTPAVPSSALEVLENEFDAAAQQGRGAWWLPEQISVKYGMVNVAAYYRSQPTWAMTLAGDDSGRFPISSSAAFACWALLSPLAADLLEPLQLRGPDNGAFDADTTAARWAAVADRYAQLAIATPDVTVALAAMTPGHGWSTRDAAGQVEAKQRLLAALGDAIGPDTVRRWRTRPLRELAARYVAKSKRGPAESRAVLVKAVQPTVAGWFGGDWLALLSYLGQQAADAEVIQTALPAPRLYVEGSAKVQEVARERNLPVEQVSAMLASYLGSGAVQSPVQRRVEAVRAWWDALDVTQAAQRPGMKPMDAQWDSQLPTVGSPTDPFPDPAGTSWLPEPVRTGITQLWATTMLPTKPDRLVSTLSPTWAMRPALGPALEFWFEIGQTCWYICEGPSARTDLTGLRRSYHRHLVAIADAGTPVDKTLFDELEAAEAQLGPPEPLIDPGEPIDPGYGITLTFSVGHGTRRAGFEILRDILTRHRRTWAATHLDAAIRAAWEQPLRELADEVNQAVAARGKLPTARQLAKMAAPVANAWFGGDLSATLAAVGERPVIDQAVARLLPDDRAGYCRRVWRAIGGEPARDRQNNRYWTSVSLLSLAANAPRMVQKEELLGHPPTAKEAGYDTYHNWPGGLDFERYLQAATAARTSDPEDGAEYRTLRATADAAPACAAPAPPTAARANPRHPAAWYPEADQPGVLRWWDGRGWTPATAPGPGASAGWFSDPERTDQLRWFDGSDWTGRVAPTLPAGKPSPASKAGDVPPWEVRGLPCGLTDADFAAARQVAATLTDTIRVGPHLLEPARGPWAAYLGASGTYYEHNQKRLRALATRTPLARTGEGWSVYPAVLIPDPSQSEDGIVPVAACSETGYVGSVWSKLARSWAERVASRLVEQRYVVTRVAVASDNSELVAKIWLPSLDLPPWQQSGSTSAERPTVT